jgi:hypothetical protein
LALVDVEGNPDVIPRGCVFEARGSRDGYEIFRLSRMTEFAGLVMAALLLAVGHRALWEQLKSWGAESGSSLFLSFLDAAAAGLGLLLACGALRGAFTAEALLIDTRGGCLRWRKKIPFRARAATLNLDQMRDLLCEYVYSTDAEGQATCRFNLSIRRSTGEEWLRVAHLSDRDSTMRLAQILISLTGREMRMRDDGPPR